MYCCFLDVGCFVQLNGWVGSFVFSSDIVDSLEGHSHNRTGIFKKKICHPLSQTQDLMEGQDGLAPKTKLTAVPQTLPGAGEPGMWLS